MQEFYPQIKFAHVSLVVSSGGLLLLRGLMTQSGFRDLALAAPVRYLSYAVDTALLTAAMMLLSILPLATFANGWLVAKLLLLPAYVFFGWLALRRGGPGGAGIGFLVAAFLIYGIMFAIARTHDPLAGMLRPVEFSA